MQISFSTTRPLRSISFTYEFSNLGLNFRLIQRSILPRVTALDIIYGRYLRSLCFVFRSDGACDITLLIVTLSALVTGLLRRPAKRKNIDGYCG
jgi:hypothetical protein